jgi:hypothetical protein
MHSAAAPFSATSTKFPCHKCGRGHDSQRTYTTLHCLWATRGANRSKLSLCVVSSMLVAGASWSRPCLCVVRRPHQRKSCVPRLPHPLERRRPGHPHSQASQGRVRETSIIGGCVAVDVYTLFDQWVRRSEHEELTLIKKLPPEPYRLQIEDLKLACHVAAVKFVPDVDLCFPAAGIEKLHASGTKTWSLPELRLVVTVLPRWIRSKRGWHDRCGLLQYWLRPSP